MKALVTGAAGFIGSHLIPALLDGGAEVVGIDCFTDYYARSVKERNLAAAAGAGRRFAFVEDALQTAPLDVLLDGVTTVFHLAAQAGVRKSWGEDFRVYTSHNVDATQRLLEAVKERRLHRFVYASSSSVYGDVATIPMREDSFLQPVSPYGVTKLAAEHLCHLYHVNYGVPAVSLRYFTVYGPRQRPGHGVSPLHPRRARRAADHPVRRRRTDARLHVRRRTSWPRRWRRATGAGPAPSITSAAAAGCRSTRCWT